MSQTQVEYEIEPRFEPRTCRHLVDGRTYVLHCHHYATLYTQLAEDCGMLDGKKLLAESAEDTFYEIFHDFFVSGGALPLEERFAIGERLFRTSGLGTLQVKSAGNDCGEVVLPTSHLDAGWTSKWGRSNRPVNHLARGFIAALFAAAFDRRPRTYAVTETDSIAMGASESRFVVVTE